MDTEVQAQIYETLYTRCDDIVQAWLEQLKNLIPMPLNVAELRPRLRKLTEQMIARLVAEPFDPTPLQESCMQFDITDNLQPEALLKIQMTLAHELLNGLPATSCVELQSRLAGVLGAFLSGLFIGRADRVKRFDMNAMSKMGHDLKTPINAITGFSRVILKGIDGPVTEFQQQDLTSIFEAGQKLLTMINDTFETAKNDARKTNIYGSSFEVAELLGDLFTTGQPIIAKHAHTLEIRSIGDLGSMRADASQVRWIILSLLLHASRLATQRTIALTALRERVQEVDWLIFEITEALPSEAIAKARQTLLAPQEAEQSDAEIGLTVGHRFCLEMGGSWQMTTNEAGVATFTVRLPARVTPLDDKRE